MKKQTFLKSMALPALALVGFSGLVAQEVNRMESVPVPEQSLMESGLLTSSYSLERERERASACRHGLPPTSKTKFPMGKRL